MADRTEPSPRPHITPERPEPLRTERTLIVTTAHRRASRPAGTNSSAMADRAEPLPHPHIAPEQPAITDGTLGTAGLLEELIPGAR
jgi:hypothetical protein